MAYRILLLGVFAIFGCERNNAAFCDGAHPCASGLCDLVTNQCDDSSADLSAGTDGGITDALGADLGPVCPQPCSGTTPICQLPTCVACTAASDPEAACLSTSANTPHCLMTGACAGCRDESDCTNPSAHFCELTTHVCRGCVSDDECASKVCDLTPGSSTVGQCVPMGKVVYVGPTNCDDGGGNDGLTAAKPFCKINVAVGKATQLGAVAVHIANILNGSYSSENVSLNNVTLSLVGETGATIQPNGNAPAVEIKGANSKVALRNLILRRGTGMLSSGITCTGGGSVNVVTCTAAANDFYGIDADQCDLVLDRSVVGSPLTPGNNAGGVRVGKNFRITNSFIIKNGLVGALMSGGGVVINSVAATSATREFINNTVADNNGSVDNAGVSCADQTTPVVLVNSLLYANKNGVVVSETNCNTSYVCVDDKQATAANNVDLRTAVPGFQAINEYHLSATSVCRDKGRSNGAPTVDIDGQPRPDPTSMKVDIGADEVQ